MTADFGKFAKNRSYYTVADSFGPLRAQNIGGTRNDPITAKTGAFLQDNGDILVKNVPHGTLSYEIYWSDAMLCAQLYPGRLA